jgi:hypothetical protein
MWHNWDQQEKPWRKLLKITDETDRDLFFCSTTVAIGDGKLTPFLDSRWLNGVSPKELTPNLYKSAKFKHRIVHTEMRKLNWIKSLGEIRSSSLIEEFTLLFMALSSIELSQQKD